MYGLAVRVACTAASESLTSGIWPTRLMTVMCICAAAAGSLGLPLKAETGACVAVAMVEVEVEGVIDRL